MNTRILFGAYSAATVVYGAAFFLHVGGICRIVKVTMHARFSRWYTWECSVMGDSGEMSLARIDKKKHTVAPTRAYMYLYLPICLHSNNAQKLEYGDSLTTRINGN